MALFIVFGHPIEQYGAKQLKMRTTLVKLVTFLAMASMFATAQRKGPPDPALGFIAVAHVVKGRAVSRSAAELNGQGGGTERIARGRISFDRVRAALRQRRGEFLPPPALARAPQGSRNDRADADHDRPRRPLRTFHRRPSENHRGFGKARHGARNAHNPVHAAADASGSAGAPGG